jgi:hypothetical protein
MTLSALGILSAAGAGQLRVGVAGYFGGGFEVAEVATVDKFAFPSDTRSTLGTGLSSAKDDIAGMANSGVAGYFGGGGGSGTVDKFAFPSDTRSNTGNITTRNFSGGMANSGVAGYFGGGETAGGSRLTSVNKITFPADSISTVATALGVATTEIAGFADSGVAGYFLGGDADLDSGTRRLFKYTFPSETYSVNNGFLPNNEGSKRAGAMANSGVAGYFGGGQRASIWTTVHKIAFPSDTRTSLGTGLSAARFFLGGMANSGVAGYFAGGQTATSTSTRVATVDVFAFPSDTRSTLGTGLSAIRTRIAGMADSGVL